MNFIQLGGNGVSNKELYVGNIFKELDKQMIQGSACLWDSMPETFPGSGIKMGGLVCPCKKCSIYC